MAERNNPWHIILGKSDESGEPCLKYKVLPHFERDKIEPAIGGRAGKNNFVLTFDCKRRHCNFRCQYFFEVNGTIQRIQRVDDGDCSRDRIIEDSSS
jgi:hypothetical protein